MNKLFLNLVMIPSSLWRSMGADTEQLRAILKVRLLMDDRKPPAIGRQRQKKEHKNGGIYNIFVYLMFGLFYMLPILLFKDRIFAMSVYFTLLVMVMTLSLITDFSSVLFDARDKYILFPRPVNDRTLLLARMLHVFIYLFRIILPMSLPAWVMLGIQDGWKSVLLFPLPLVLVVLIALFLVNSVYILVLRLTKPEKFKDVINYFQVVISIIFFASAYTTSSMLRYADPENPLHLDITRYPWIKFLPSYWLGECWSWIGYPVNLAGTNYFWVMGLILPVVCMYVLIRWLAPQFASRIGGIDTVDTGPVIVPGGKRQAAGKLYQRLANIFNRSDDAKAGFMITWLQTSRSRAFRMKVYPTFAYVPIYFVYNLTLGRHSLSYTFDHLKDGSRHLFLLYMTSFVMISAMTQLYLSEQYKASWIYYSTPVEKPGAIMLGAFKALWVKYMLPFFIGVSLFVIYIWGPAAIWDILLGLVNVSFFGIFMARFGIRSLPFSILEQGKQSGGKILKSFFSMILPMLLGFGHYFAIDLLWLKLVFLGLSSILLWLVADSYANTTWDDIATT